MTWFCDKTGFKALTDSLSVFRIVSFRQNHPEEIKYKERYKND
jgi:hypothetical protein